MTRPRCSRAWQAEAVLDGVLSRADAASFERHAATCSECSAERAALLRLGSVARRLPSQEVSPLHRRAQHNELLRRANELSTGTAPSRFAHLRVSVPLALAVLGLLLFSWLRPPAKPAVSSATPIFQLQAAADSRWRVAEPGRLLRLALESGRVTIAVNKLQPGQRFSVTLPDGELEVRGTRFSVECDAKHTQRVTVDEGRVALRLQGRPALSLGAGEAFAFEAAATAAPKLPVPAPDAVPATAPALGSSPAESAASTLLIGSGQHAPTRRAAGARQGAGPAEGSAPRPAVSAVGPGNVSSAQPSSAAREFAEAMAAFSHGDFGTAERLFAAFEARHPQSPHVEDMLFLKALGRSRRGDVNGARSLALEYLRRFPAGFRSVEAQRLAAPHPGLAANPGLVTFP